MVQIFDLTPTPSNASMIGNALGQGINKNFPDPQQLVQRGMLEKALSQLPENASYVDMLKTIGPQLMTTPGGPQLLAEMGPVLQRNAQSKAYMDYLKGSGAGTQTQGASGLPADQSLPNEKREAVPYGEKFQRNPQSPVGQEGTYPKMSVLPEPKPLMTPQEMQNRKQQLAMSYLSQGQPVDQAAIENVVMNEQNQITAYNKQVEQERQTRNVAQQDRSKRMLTRFDNSSIVPRSAEDKTVFEKFANEAKDAANENDAYKYARTKYDQFENARNGLIRDVGLPGMGEKLIQKARGTYKNKEDMIKGLQPNLKILKDLGLQDQAREILSTDVGLGMEDTELALYPPSKEESNAYNTFAKNPNYVKNDPLFTGKAINRFPGEEVSLEPQQFMEFKDNIADLLKQYPETNIVALRGVLNQNKGYAWNDIARAFVELIDEGRYETDPIIEQQLNVIKSPPLPGIAELFKEFWTGTK